MRLFQLMFLFLLISSLLSHYCIVYCVCTLHHVTIILNEQKYDFTNSHRTMQSPKNLQDTVKFSPNVAAI